MNDLKFYIGEETGIVVEKEHFSESLFDSQYRQVFSLLNDIYHHQETQQCESYSPQPNIIAICGDRGAGKTSLLQSVLGIIRNKDIFQQAKGIMPADIDKDYLNSVFHVLDIIDPSYFDKKHNLLELLLGQMYAELQDKIENNNLCNNGFIEKKNDLLKQFSKVKSSLSIINKQLEKEGSCAYDELEEIDKLAAGVSLKSQLDHLFKLYVETFGKKRLLISIDDLDLNLTDGYIMTEEVRKYLLNSPYCIVLFAVKVEQLTKIVQLYMFQQLTGGNSDNNDKLYQEASNMAKPYVEKLIPDSLRVWMPNGDILPDAELKIFQKCEEETKYKKGDSYYQLFSIHEKKDEGNEKNEETKNSFESLKEGIVQLIYQKTRYIFVNGASVSPIVPTSLRSINYLLELLLNMDDNKRGYNKQSFKRYFYQTWTKCLGEKDRAFVNKLVVIDDETTTNQFVIDYLREKYYKRGEYDYSWDRFRRTINISKNGNIYNETDDSISTDKLFKLLIDIMEPKNQSFNISLGDVYYVLQLLGHSEIDKEDVNLFFFIRSFYSIRLYELYDHISADEKHLHIQPSQDDEPSIYKYDPLLRRLNKLQKLLNGSYFTYNSGDFLPFESSMASRDKRIIKTDKLQEWGEELKGKNANDIQNELIGKLQMCEFFALTTKLKSATGDENDINRKTPTPRYIESYPRSTRSLLFDVLSLLSH